MTTTGRTLRDDDVLHAPLSLSLDPSRRSEAVFILRTMFVTTRQRRFLSGKRQNTLSPKGIIKSSLLSKGVEEEIEDRDNNFLLFFFVLCVCLQHESPYERQKKAKRWGGGGKKKDQKKRSTYKRGKRKKRDPDCSIMCLGFELLFSSPFFWTFLFL